MADKQTTTKYGEEKAYQLEEMYDVLTFKYAQNILEACERKKERKSKTDEVENQMRRRKSNRNTTQAAHTIWNDIDDGVHTCDAYVYFEDAGLSPPDAQHKLID